MANRKLTLIATVLCTISLVALIAGCGAGASSTSSSSTDASSSGAGTEQALGEASDLPSSGGGSSAGTSASKSDAEVERVLQSLTLEQKVAQLFVVTPEDLAGTGYAVTEAGPATESALAARPVGGVCFFDQNLEDPSQTREMLATMNSYSEAACGLPLLMCVDEEGGTVTRVADDWAFGVQDAGDMADVGATGDPQISYQAGYSMGTYLSDLGFNVDFAPVADIVTDPYNDAMAQRSFGSDPQLVADMVAAQVRGFTDAGLLCTAKHFPGIGGAAGGDSHQNTIVSEATLAEMKETNLVPFQAAIDAGVPIIMVGHLSCPNVTGDYEPASVSPAIMTDLLRNDLGYDGLIVTDSLSMGAVANSYTTAEASVAAIQAGADMVLMVSDFDESYEAVLNAVQSEEISEERIDESVRRIIAAKLALRD